MPYLCFTSSGGARAEGLLSLAQMAKTTASLTTRATQAAFVTVLTDPTMGGVSASASATSSSPNPRR